MKRHVFAKICFSVCAISFASLVEAKSSTEPSLHTDAPVQAYQKPGAPVTLVSKASYRLAVGQETTIDLGLKLAPGTTKVRLQNDEGLIVKGSDRWETSDVQSQQSLKVTALTAQKAYIHVFVEHLAANGYKTTRALAIAIDSRSAQQALKAKPPVKPYIEMQASETIY